jgi:hypothetical protein
MLQDPVHSSSTDPDIRPLRAADGCTNTKTPASAFPLVTGSLGTSYRVPPAGDPTDGNGDDQRFCGGRVTVAATYDLP